MSTEVAAVLIHPEQTNSTNPTNSKHQHSKPSRIRSISSNYLWILLIVLFFAFYDRILYWAFMSGPSLTTNTIGTEHALDHYVVHHNGTQLDCMHKTSWDYLWFQHIRKSGGTSISGVLVSNQLIDRSIHGSYVAQSRYYKFWFLSHDLEGLEARADAIHSKAISIETQSFRTHEFLQHPLRFHKVLLMTVIRDPIERAWSDLNYPFTWKCGAMVCDE